MSTSYILGTNPVAGVVALNGDEDSVRSCGASFLWEHRPYTREPIMNKITPDVIAALREMLLVDIVATTGSDFRFYDLEILK